MCRNIKTLYNFDPPASAEEIRASSLQFVRKVSGMRNPSHVNEAAFHLAVEEVSAVSRNLLESLTTKAKPRNRDSEAIRSREQSLRRFPKSR